LEERDIEKSGEVFDSVPEIARLHLARIFHAKSIEDRRVPKIREIEGATRLVYRDFTISRGHEFSSK